MTTRPHIMIVEARFYADISDELARGAIAALTQHQVTYQRFTVSGALEIPAAIGFALESARRFSSPYHFDGFIALGCVIRGETTHYDIVAQESARGLQDLAIREHLAIGNGILTVENEEQAWVRARIEDQNKGGAAALACLQMIDLKNLLKK